MCESRLKAEAAAALDDSALMDCVESVSLLSLPDDCVSLDTGQADSKASTRKFSPRYRDIRLLETNIYVFVVIDFFSPMLTSFSPYCLIDSIIAVVIGG